MKNGAGIALGAVLVVIGGLFTLQGLGYVSGSAMTGVTLWAVVGPIVALVGVVMIVQSVRNRRRD